MNYGGNSRIEPPVTYDYVTKRAYYGCKPLFNKMEIGIHIKHISWALQAEGLSTYSGSTPLNHYQLFQIIQIAM